MEISGATEAGEDAAACVTPVKSKRPLPAAPEPVAVTPEQAAIVQAKLKRFRLSLKK